MSWVNLRKQLWPSRPTLSLITATSSGCVCVCVCVCVSCSAVSDSLQPHGEMTKCQDLLSTLNALFYFHSLIIYKRENFYFCQSSGEASRVREDVSLKKGHTTWKAGTWFLIWDCLTLALKILVAILYSRISFVLFSPAGKVPMDISQRVGCLDVFAAWA